jgi:hypothetical protein
MERLARNFVRRHQEDFWASWNMDVLNLESHDMLPFYLRQIRLGPDGGSWAAKGEAFLRGSSRVFKDLYLPDVQRSAVAVLQDTHAFMRRRFAVSRDEELQMGGFVPAAGAVIQMGFSYRGGNGADDVIDEAYAAKRRLSVASLEKAQGASGRAFLLGASIETSRRGPQGHRNFTAEMMESWTREQSFSSLVCVPIYDSKDWVPIGVSYLTSNQQQPFWASLDPQDYDDLVTLLRNTFTEVLEYTPI